MVLMEISFKAAGIGRDVSFCIRQLFKYIEILVLAYPIVELYIFYIYIQILLMLIAFHS